jgi:hypothetical protein
MNPKTKILSLRGQELPKSLPTQEEIDKLPKRKTNDKDGNKIEIPDIDKLERETVGNIILNCLATYVADDKREGFYINMIAHSIITGDIKIEFKEKLKTFILKVLDEATARKVKERDENGVDKEVDKGMYHSWVIAQVKKELGFDEEE